MKTLTIVATAFNEKWQECIFVPSMLNQTCQDFEAIVFHNGPSERDMGDEFLGLQNIRYMESPVNTNCWGAHNRQKAIEDCTTDYILQTSIQDYFLSQAVEYIQRVLVEEPDLVLWNSINHLVGPCQVLDSKLEWSKLDWGNFCIKTSIAKEIGINYPTEYCSDWLFIQDCLRSGLLKNIKKINGVLTIHN
jgi:hypothetical protein